ncbi:precorrin-4 C(11)-methyltransferase [filamentous cyanobacterium LEGE 11480]|uniref:Precorrin-4 C(11)-methyltransferase n=1 Tax=Romeriopsis navalis LEGE 11480 TaxID=2777977 RepID=A0A928VPK5_9CYAN|nr:precorrin-4 C(11)-methyltransferase [Romeriopsis navalis]MBE9030202.1 precorrin-4 C(11)-methyltransferase [Romeriopsis navalis LEGE 11480]
MPKPIIHFIGAGPGDPDLITVKGARLLKQADVVVYADSLIPIDLINHYVKPKTEIIPTADKSLAQILEILVDRAQSGKTVIRLHDGDPCLYGAIQEQMNGLLAAGIDFEIIPGVSAYQLAAAKLRVELTQPQQIQSIILTRVSGRTQVPATEELETMAAHQASLCLYLSARHVQKAQTKLLKHYPADTPVAICFRVGWKDERILVVPLTAMASTTDRENLIRTTMYVVSPALKAATVPTEYGTSHISKPTTTATSNLYAADYDRLFRRSHELKQRDFDD